MNIYKIYSYEMIIMVYDQYCRDHWKSDTSNEVMTNNNDNNQTCEYS